MRTRAAVLLLALLCPAMSQAADLFTDVPQARRDALDTQADSPLDRLSAQRTTRALTTVGVNTDALSGDSVTINLPTAPGLKARVKKIDRRGPRDFTWYGELPGSPGTATLVVRGDKVTGTIRNNKELYRILSLGNGVHALIQIDEGAFPEDHPPGANDRIGGAAVKLSGDQAADVGSPVIDVMVAYTANAESRSGDIHGLIQLAIDETNQAYENSKINPRVRLVHKHKVNYSESGRSFDTILGHFSSKGDTFMKEIHNLRNKYGADVAVLLVHQTDACGIADKIMASAGSAFAVAHWDCAIGYYSFGHEIGHLQGARHDPATDNTNTPYAYGHGYRYKQLWRTILAYDCPNDCPRLQYFSNPNVKYNGIPMGTADRSNNARVINGTANRVAGFRAQVVP